MKNIDKIIKDKIKESIITDDLQDVFNLRILEDKFNGNHTDNTFSLSIIINNKVDSANTVDVSMKNNDLNINYCFTLKYTTENCLEFIDKILNYNYRNDCNTFVLDSDYLLAIACSKFSHKFKDREDAIKFLAKFSLIRDVEIVDDIYNSIKNNKRETFARDKGYAINLAVSEQGHICICMHNISCFVNCGFLLIDDKLVETFSYFSTANKFFNFAI